jgi:hypothetical protein
MFVTLSIFETLSTVHRHLLRFVSLQSYFLHCLLIDECESIFLRLVALLITFFCNSPVHDRSNSLRLLERAGIVAAPGQAQKATYNRRKRTTFVGTFLAEFNLNRQRRLPVRRSLHTLGFRLETTCFRYRCQITPVRDDAMLRAYSGFPNANGSEVFCLLLESNMINVNFYLLLNRWMGT